MTTTYACVKFILDDRPPAIPTHINREELNPKPKGLMIILPKHFETTIFVLFKLTRLNNTENGADEKDIKIIAVLEILQYQDSISIQKYQTIESISTVSTIFILSALKQFNYKDIYVFSRPTNNLIFHRESYLKSKQLIKYWEVILNDIQLIENTALEIHKFKEISDIKTINCKTRIIFPDTPEFKSIEYLNGEIIRQNPGFDILQIKKKTLFECINYRQDFMGSAIFFLKKVDIKNINPLIKTNIKNKQEVLDSINIMFEKCIKIVTKQNPLKYLKKLTLKNNEYLVWDLIDNYEIDIEDFRINETIIRDKEIDIEIVNLKNIK